MEFPPPLGSRYGRFNSEHGIFIVTFSITGNGEEIALWFILEVDSRTVAYITLM